MADTIDPKQTERVGKERAIRGWTETKVKIAHRWIDENTTQKGRNFVRGAIHKVDLGENIGDEQSEYRPCLVISNDLINSTSPNVSIIPLTKTLKTKPGPKPGTTIPRYRSHYFLMIKKYNFLEYDSAVLGEEVKTVSKVRIGDHMGIIDPEDVNKIINRVKWVIGI